MRIELHHGPVVYEVIADIDARGSGTVVVRRGRIEIGTQWWMAGEPQGREVPPALQPLADELLGVFRVAHLEARATTARPAIGTM
ncbi:MAG TPA: hypothetical protein VEL07_18530 [Planctomycetota bacterium]|nr:hypothetical protein [Planctomycetota bacterium]